MRKNKYKGVKWEDTRFAKPYKMRQLIARAQAAEVLASSIVQIHRQRYTGAGVVQLALTCVNTMSAVAKVLDVPSGRIKKA